MFPVQSLAVMLGLTLCILPSCKTMAQQYSERDVVYEAARNKIGLIRYCRKKGLLDPATADQVITAVETGLYKLLPGDAFAGRQGDRAQQAGEDGFWEAGRRRDIDSVAKLFHTTPADLCQEWAEETLRGQPPKLLYREVKTVIVPAAPRPIQPRSQVEPTAVEPILVDRWPVIATAAVGTAPSAPPPPLPEKAPFLPVKAEPASLQHALPTAGQLASTGRALTPSAMPQSWGQQAPLSARPDAEAEEPLPREETVTEAEPADTSENRPPPRWRRLPFKRLGRSERCLMPGCRWPSAPQEKRSSGY